MNIIFTYQHRIILSDNIQNGLRKIPMNLLLYLYSRLESTGSEWGHFDICGAFLVVTMSMGYTSPPTHRDTGVRNPRDSETWTVLQNSPQPMQLSNYRGENPVYNHMSLDLLFTCKQKILLEWLYYTLNFPGMQLL